MTDEELTKLAAEESSFVVTAALEKMRALPDVRTYSKFVGLVASSFYFAKLLIDTIPPEAREEMAEILAMKFTQTAEVVWGLGAGIDVLKEYQDAQAASGTIEADGSSADPKPLEG